MSAKKVSKAKPVKPARMATIKAKAKAKLKLPTKIKGAQKKAAAGTSVKAISKAAAYKVIRVGKAASRPEPSRAAKNRGIPNARQSKPMNGKAINGSAQRINGSSVGGGAAARMPAAKLSKTELEKFRSLLLEKRREILGDVGSMESEAFRNQDNHSSSPMHMADVGTDNFEQEFTLGLIESERELLKEIQEAIARIEDGTFGVCVATGKAIGKARLEAKPWAKYCIEYARMLESGMLPRNGNENATVEMADEEDD